MNKYILILDYVSKPYNYSVEVVIKTVFFHKPLFHSNNVFDNALSIKDINQLSENKMVLVMNQIRSSYSKILPVTSLFTFMLTTMWLILLMMSLFTFGEVESFERALEYAEKSDLVYYLTYLNASLITIFATILFSGLYYRFNSIYPEWSIIALIFVPVYCVFNLFAYISQITIIPMLFELRNLTEYETTLKLLISQMVQPWPGSAIFVLNNLAYAILGIPSIIFGIMMIREKLRFPGILMTLNGVTCIIGIIGISLSNDLLSQASIVGGVLFFFALIPLTIDLYKEKKLLSVK
jgi:hypothetical protein